MWLADNGKRFPSMLRAPIELPEAGNDWRPPKSITVDGRALRIIRRGIRYTLHNELGHQGVSGAAWCCELADGSFIWILRDLMTGRWFWDVVAR